MKCSAEFRRYGTGQYFRGRGTNEKGEQIMRFRQLFCRSEAQRKKHQFKTISRSINVDFRLQVKGIRRFSLRRYIGLPAKHQGLIICHFDNTGIFRVFEYVDFVLNTVHAHQVQFVFFKKIAVDCNRGKKRL